MKIVSSITKLTYEMNFTKHGENNLPCPECNSDRKHKNRKSFSFNTVEKIGHCFNCEADFYEYKPFKGKKEYKAPEHKNNTSLLDNAVKWFEGRAISQSTLIKMGIYSDTEYMPQVEKESSVICFPFFMDSKLVNIKFRSYPKNFKLVKDAELIFYNIDALKDAKEIIITEGEIDCLSFIEAGLLNCISVPNGASGKNLEYLDNSIHLFDTIEKIYIATDNDIKGIELRNELIRRFSPEKCAIVLFNDCKDANEYLVRHGAFELSETIKNAFDIPVEGIINLNSHYDDIYSMYVNGLPKGKTIGLADFDNAITWETSRLVVVTGIPGHGKSEVVDFIAMKLNILHGWKVAYFSPENYPIKYHYSKLASKLTGKAFNQGAISQTEFEETFNYIEDNFFFIFPEEDLSLENILIKAKHLIRKNGIKILIIDPWNSLEHLKDRGETETEYISKALSRITSFAKQYNVLVILVAHPKKMDKNANGLYSMPTLYDINGSANFYNKCDYGLSVYRNNIENIVQVNVIKVKFKHLGGGGAVLLKYNYNNGRYEPEGLPITNWDNMNYLHPTSKLEPTPEQLQEIEFNKELSGFNDFATDAPF